MSMQPCYYNTHPPITSISCINFQVIFYRVGYWTVLETSFVKNKNPNGIHKFSQRLIFQLICVRLNLIFFNDIQILADTEILFYC